MFKKVLIIADIEGSSGCTSYAGSCFRTDEWADACIDMSLDITAVVESLFQKGVEKIYVKDFHRTGFNLIPELIDKRAFLVSGYRQGPVFGLGSPFDAEAVLFTGMHSSSGSEGFLPHTLTSRHACIRVNGKNVSEFQLFSSSLYPYALSPVFFSGCPVACSEVLADIPGISVLPVSGKGTPSFDRVEFRRNLGLRAASSLDKTVEPYTMEPPFEAEIRVRDGEDAASKIAKRWKLKRSGDFIYFNAGTFDELYSWLIRISYLSPWTEHLVRPGLFFYNIYGRQGLNWVRKKKKGEILSFMEKRKL